MRIILYVRKNGGVDSAGRSGLTTDQAFSTLAYALKRVPLQLLNDSYVIDCDMRDSSGNVVPETVPEAGLNLLPYISNLATFSVASPDKPYFNTEGALTIRAEVTSQYTFSSFSGAVQDSVTGLWTITVDTTGQSPAITTDSLKGKFIVGAASGQMAVIASNTVTGNTTTLELTLSGSTPIALTAPLQVGVPAGALHNPTTEQTPVLVTRGMTASFVVVGFALTHANTATSSSACGVLLQLNAVSRLLLCEVDGIQVNGTAVAPIFRACYIRGGGGSPNRVIRRINAAYQINNCFVRTIEFTSQNLGAGYSTFFSNSILEGCAHLGDHWGHGTYDGPFRIDHCYVRDSLTHGIRFNSGPVCRLDSVRVDRSAKSAIAAQGPGSLEVFGVVGSGNTDYGIVAFDGVHVTVNAATDVTGSLGAVKAGVNLAVRSWADFRATFPVRNEVDYAGRTLGDVTRVWQELP